MKIEILGTGCYNCVRLERMVGEALKELGKTQVSVARIDDEHQIRSYMSLDEIPGLVIEGHLVSSRELPEREMLKQWLSEL